MRLFFLLFCALCSPAFAQVQPTSVIMTKGNLLFEEKAVTFQTKDKKFQYPFPPVKEGISHVGGTERLQVPGLFFQSYKLRTASAPDGTETDHSQLIFTASDRSSIELTKGEPLEVFRVEITFSDQRQIILWQPASKMK
jgi:hypothetical protein